MDKNIESLRKLLGKTPSSSSFTTEVVETVDCGSYVREYIRIKLQDDIIPAFVLVPKENKKRPAIYCHHQHGSNWDLGKSEAVGLLGDKSLAYAHELAEQGFIAFAPDAICFEERKKNEDGWFGTYLEYTSRTSYGSSLAAKIFSDLRVGVDYLCQREDVDSERIGFIGHSYGGRVALWAPALDKRIKAAVSNCGCINHKDSFKHEYGIQMEFTILGFLEWGDVEDVVRLVEPSHLLISATQDDKYSTGYQHVYDYAKQSFSQGTLELQVYPGGHQFTKEMREEAYHFLTKNL